MPLMLARQGSAWLTGNPNAADAADDYAGRTSCRKRRPLKRRRGIGLTGFPGRRPSAKAEALGAHSILIERLAVRRGSSPRLEGGREEAADAAEYEDQDAVLPPRAERQR